MSSSPTPLPLDGGVNGKYGYYKTRGFVTIQIAYSAVRIVK
jgi:hypothetical protein